MRLANIIFILLIFLACHPGRGLSLFPESGFKSYSLKEFRSGKELESVNVKAFMLPCEGTRRTYIVSVYTKSDIWNDLDCPYKTSWKIVEKVDNQSYVPVSVSVSKRYYDRGRKVYEISFDDGCKDISSTILFMTFPGGSIELVW